MRMEKNDYISKLKARIKELEDRVSRLERDKYTLPVPHIPPYTPWKPGDYIVWAKPL